MSHFSVVVCIDDQDGKLAAAPRLVPERLTEVLAPWDENLDVEPYRSYEDGEAAAYRAVDALRKDEGLNPDDATLTWAQVVEAANRRYPHKPMMVDDDGRAYSMSTYNPESKWDWWTIGGSWAGYFVARKGAERRVIAPVRNHRSGNVIAPGRCDGGVKADLDLDALRKAKAAEAVKTRNDWLAAVAGTPEAMSWKSFADNVGKLPGYTIERAREEYHSQPRIQAISETDFRWHDDPVAEFAVPEKLYVTRAMARAVPGYATITADGRWMAPGRMGWFGMGTQTESEEIGYCEAANAYIEALPDATFLVAIDCHI